MKAGILMKKLVVILLFFFLFFTTIPTINCFAETKVIKRGFYTLKDLDLSPSKEYKIQNVSFNDRIYVLILDSKETPIQSIRLWPQSQKYNLFPLEEGYKIIVTGDGEIVIS